MGPVSAAIIDLIKKQVEKEHLVVWFDPEQHYSSVIESLKISDAIIEKFEGSFLKIRHDVSSLMRNDEPPNLLIYIPLAEEDTYDALAAFTAAGSVIKPGQNSIHLNSRLSVIAGRVLKNQGKDESEIREIEKKISSDLLTLADLDHMTGIVASPVSETLRLIFKSADPLDITLLFLSHNEYDSVLDAKSAYSELAQLLQLEYGIVLPDDNLDSWRPNLARYLLISSFLGELSGAIPENLSSIPHATEEVQLIRSLSVISEWQKRIDIITSYQSIASKIDEPLGIRSLSLSPDQIKNAFTFRSCDYILLKQIEIHAEEWAAEDLISLTKARLNGIWARIDPEIQNRWSILYQMGEFIRIADSIEETLSAHRQMTPTQILKKYTEGDNPWYLLDTHHRRLEKLYHTLDFGISLQNELIDKLIKRARVRYTKVAGTLADRFTHGLEDSHLDIGSILHQRKIADTFLIPSITKEKTAYLLVDAFRYEMAIELCSVLSDEYKTDIQPAIASIPTITEIGMTSLLPGLEEKPTLVNAGNGTIAIQIGDKLIKTRNDRMNYLSSHIQGSIAIFTTDDIIPHPNQETIKQIKESNLIVITSQEIDIFGESHPKAARRYFEDIIGDLKRIISLLRMHQVKNIVISADHGFLLGEEVDESMKINPPGGNTVDLHRRIWIGTGGAANSSYLRVRASTLGYSSDLEIATPYGLGVFKVAGGSTLFFHGGLSPQELIIPVICITPDPVKPTIDQDITWKFEYDESGITIIIWSCKIIAQSKGISGIESRKIKCDLQLSGESIGKVISAIKGFEKETGEVAFEPNSQVSTQQMENSITFKIDGDIREGLPILTLYDANTGEKLASQEIPMKISF